MKRKLKRAERQKPGKSRVTERDLRGLVFIWKAQPVTTGQYARFLEMGESVRRRLRALRNHGLVVVHTTAVEEENRYTLGLAARPLLSERLGREPEEIAVLRGIGKTNLPHHSGAVDLYVSLVLATNRMRGVTLERFLFEAQVRAVTGAAQGTLVPDAVAVIVTPGGERLAIAVEIDLGTVSPNVMARKGLAYGELRTGGQPLMGCHSWCVACVVPTQRRRNRLALALYEAGVPERQWFFAVAASLTDRTIFTSVWWTVRVSDDGQSAQLASANPFQRVLTTRPNGSDGSVPRKVSQRAEFAHAADRERVPPSSPLS